MILRQNLFTGTTSMELVSFTKIFIEYKDLLKNLEPIK